MCNTINGKRTVSATCDDIDISRLQKLYHTLNLYDLTSSVAVTVAKLYQIPNLYDVMSHKKHLLEENVYNKVYMIWLFQYHTPYQPRYQPSTNIIPRADYIGVSG